MKKLLTIFLILFLSSAITLGVYNFIYLPYQDDINRPGPEDDIGKKTENFESRVFAASDEAVLAPAVSADKSHINYYIKSNGNVIETDFNGKNKQVKSDFTISNLSYIKWSPDKNKVLCAVFEDNQEKPYIYNYAEKKKYDLNPNSRNIVFSPSGAKIAYNYRNNSDGTNNISIADADSKNWKVILNTRLNNPVIEWKDNFKAAIFERASYKNSSSVLIVDVADLKLDRILSGKYGLSAKFSPDGKKIIYSASDSAGKRLKLYSSDDSGENEIEIKTAAFAEKCVFSRNNKDVFCAAAQVMPSSNLPDQFYQSNFKTKDYFIKFNSETGEEEIILPKDNSLNIDARELFLSPTEDKLYFVNYVDGKLYGVSL